MRLDCVPSPQILMMFAIPLNMLKPCSVAVLRRRARWQASKWLSWQKVRLDARRFSENVDAEQRLDFLDAMNISVESKGMACSGRVWRRGDQEGIAERERKNT